MVRGHATLEDIMVLDKTSDFIEVETVSLLFGLWAKGNIGGGVPFHPVSRLLEICVI